MSEAAATPSQAAIGRALGLSPAAVTKLKGQGMPVHSVEAAQAWREQRQNIAARKPLPASTTTPSAPAVAPRIVLPPPDVADHDIPDFNESRARKEAAEADMAEQKASQMRGELAPKAVMNAFFIKQMVAWREGLLNSIDRLGPLLAAESNVAACNTILRRELTAILSDPEGMP